MISIDYDCGHRIKFPVPEARRLEWDDKKQCPMCKGELSAAVILWSRDRGYITDIPRVRRSQMVETASRYRFFYSIAWIVVKGSLGRLEVQEFHDFKSFRAKWRELRRDKGVIIDCIDKRAVETKCYRRVRA